MKLLLKRMSYKILVISMITVVLSFFCVSSVSQAKLKLKEGEYYYTGTKEAEGVTVDSSFWEKLLGALATLANYLLGIMTLGIRGVIVGWFEIFEIILTALLGVEADIGQFFSDAMAGMDGYTQQVVNVEKIIFNEIPILSVNIFSTDDLDDTSTSEEAQKLKQDEDSKEVIKIIRNAVAKWYYVMRLIVIAFMLILLIFIGIKMALSTIGSEKAVYKQMLVDWMAGMVIVFMIHYIMIAIISVNESIVTALQPLAEEKSSLLEEYQYGDEQKIKTSSEIETTLYESARTRAYSLKLTDGFTGMIIYGVLVYFAWRFALIYFKRLINIIVLTLVAPAISASYAFNKVISGKAKIFSTWLSEYVMNVILQIVHVIIYVSFVSIALQLSLESLMGTILAFVLLKFMTQADKILRQLFKLSGGNGSLSGDMADHSSFEDMKNEMHGMRTAMVGGTVSKTAMKLTYGAMTKPLGALATRTTAGIVAWNKNKEGAEEKSKAKQQKSVDDYFEKDEDAVRKAKEIEELEARKAVAEKKKEQQEAKREALLEERKRLMLEAMSAGEDGTEEEEEGTPLDQNSKMLEKNRIELEANETELADIDKEIKNRENEIQEGYLNYLSDNTSLAQAFKLNLGSALDELVEYDEKAKKYKVRKIKTRREGGVKGAFWRKRTDGLGLRFRENMKLAKLFGLNSSEEKILKSEMDFWKNRIIALGSMVAGFPTLAINPLVGMGLLSNAGVTHLNVRKRKKMYKGARRNKASYTFKDFGPGAKKQLSRPETYHVVEIDQLSALNHKKIRTETKKMLQYSNYVDHTELKINKKTAKLQERYNKLMEDYKNSLENNLSHKSVEDLAFEDKARQKNVVHIGKDICMQIEDSNVAMKKFLDDVKQIDETMNQTQKLHLIEQKIGQNKNMIITEAITNICAQKGITDITEVELTDVEMKQINQHISEILEAQGIVKEGEIDLEKADINEESIVDTYLGLTSEHEQVNKMLEDNIVSASILEYMAKKGMKNTNQLNTEEAKEGIYKIVKEKVMPESSKQSGSVIKKITGKDSVEEDFELDESILESVDENTKKVRKIRKVNILDDLDEVDKNVLIEREIKRRTNESQKQIKQAMDTGDDSELTDQQLQLLFIQTELRKQEKLADELGIEIKKPKTNKK